MEKKVKKSLKASQKQIRYRIAEKVTFGSEFVSIATPYVIMGAINYDEWFNHTEGWKVGLGGGLALALMSICILIVTNKKEDKKSITGGYITLLMGWLAFAFVALLLSNIMHDIASIMFFGAIGIAGALGLDITSKKFGEKADLYKEVIKEVRKDNAKEEAKEEIRKEVAAEVEKEKRGTKW